MINIIITLLPLTHIPLLLQPSSSPEMFIILKQALVLFGNIRKMYIILLIRGLMFFFVKLKKNSLSHFKQIIDH